MALEDAIIKLQKHPTQYKQGWTFEEFEKVIFPSLERALPLALDRMEFHKTLLNDLEFKFGFNIDSLERLWNTYRPTIDKGVS